MNDLSNVKSLTIDKEARGIVLSYLTPSTNIDGSPSSDQQVIVFPQVAALVQFLADAKFTA